MPDASNNTCRALLPHGHTRCAAPLRFRTVFCAAYASAYHASYKLYKEAEKKADELRKLAHMSLVDIGRLRAHEIEQCQVKVWEYADALTEELKLRRRHIVQFIGTPDAGHSQRLEVLKRQLARHRRILRVLRTRRWLLQHVHSGIRSPERAASRIASPTPRAVRRRIVPAAEQGRRARARAEARRQREEEQEWQHSVVVEAERKRRQQDAADKDAYNRDLEIALLLSRPEQCEKEALRAEGQGEISQETPDAREGSARWELVEEAAADTAGDRLEECLLEEWPGEAGGRVDAPGATGDAASDSTSNAFSDDLRTPIQQLPEPLSVSIHVDDSDDWHLPDSTSPTIDVDEAPQSTGLAIETERDAWSDGSSITMLDFESAPSPKPTPADSQYDSQLQPVPEPVRLEVAIVVHGADDSCTQFPLAETPSGATSNQGFGDAVEGRDLLAGRSGQSGGNEGRPRDGVRGRIKQYLQCLAFAAIIALLVLRKRHRSKGLGKLWKLLKRIAHAGTRRISNWCSI